MKKELSTPQPETVAHQNNFWLRHSLEQIQFIATNTTPLQRVLWLEEMAQLFAKQLAKRGE